MESVDTGKSQEQTQAPGWRRWFDVLGPGLITGASDDDPSGISTYSVAGATAGFSMLWLVLITTPMMSVIQGMCARIGMVTGVGFATNMRKRLPLWLLYPLGVAVIGANILNAGADLEGMAASAQMVAGLPQWAWILLFGGLLLVFQIFFSYRSIFAVVKWLTLSLFAYIITAFVVHAHWGDALRHLVVPEVSWNSTWITTAMAVLGTTITPYLFFWQACLMVEEEKAMGRNSIKQRRGATQQEIADAHLDIDTGMIFSNVVAFFIIVTTAVTLHAHGLTNIQSAQDAAKALEPLAGKFAYLLFTLGMVGTGLLAIPALVGSSAYVAAESFDWKHGLDLPLKRAPGFYGALIVGMIIAMIIGFAHVNPIAALFWSAVINGVVAVPLLAVLVHFASDGRLMGKWRSSLAARIWGWATVAVMGAAAISIFVFWGKS
ncbi:MAG: divalent metal cation transporter [Candidatus Eremiobacteraeota bacterium]|nr:divalent metal cation transporter [Candidatus Eremiobacteraeota bacterium]